MWFEDLAGIENFGFPLSSLSLCSVTVATATSEDASIAIFVEISATRYYDTSNRVCWGLL